MVSGGGDHTCGILSNDRLYCWGGNSDGQVGRNTANPFYDTPVEVGGGRWRTVSAGRDHTCAIRPNGRLSCWGDDDHGQVGDGGANADRLAPTQVVGGHTDWTAVQVAGDHSCGRRANGRLYCWGDDSFGQLGNGGTDQDRTAPVLVAGGATNWTGLSAGEDHVCGRRTTGRLYCWGGDSYGTLGDGPGDSTSGTPRLVAGGYTDWTAFDAGGFHTCARRSNARLYCWGGDYSGSLGNGGAVDTNRFRPTLVAGGNVRWASVSAGYYHTCGRRSTGRILCWGADGHGQVGNGAASGDQPAPVALSGNASNWTSVVAGYTHTCARKTTGSLWCWGLNSDHQLGIGGDDDRDVPTRVPVPPQ
jgi:alpha-tubulin suppressor-like RCC1 family protein